MKAYIALTEKVAHDVEKKGHLTPCMIGCRWLPLKECREVAVKAAIQGIAINGVIAVEPVTLKVLEVTFGVQQALDLFQDQKLSRIVAHTRGWQ